MTAIDLTTLSAIADLSLAEFKDKYEEGDTVAGRYYDELARQGSNTGNTDIESYGERAADVTRDEGFQGKMANRYSEHAASEQGVDFTVGSDAWLKMQYELMLLDLATREAKILAGETGNLDRTDTDQIHTLAFQEVNLAPETFTTHIPLEQTEKNEGETAADTLWQEAASGAGVLEFIKDGWAVYFSGLPDFNGSFGEYIDDSFDQITWARNIGKALRDLFDEGAITDIENLLPIDEYPQFWDDFEDLMDQFANLPNDYGWAWNNPGAVMNELVPTWVQDLLDDWGSAEANNSPLVFDLDGNGIELVSSANGVYWDIDQDDFIEKSGWISGNDGLLAIDLNADGIINDHGELFGDDITDGFTVLSAYDSNSDGAIDNSDTQFGDLLVWVDVNSNGYSESTELYSLSDLGITSINLNASLVDYDIAGNHISHESTFTINGQTQTIVDAWFAYDNTNSHYSGNYSLDIRTLYLPALRGFGDMKDLHIAMSMDETLLVMVQELAAADTQTLLDPTFDILGKIEAIMFRWAGVDGVDPSTRGTVNAQQLEFLETYLGDGYDNPSTGWTDPTAGGVDDVHKLFAKVLSQITASLLAQTDAAHYVGENVFYSIANGQLENAENIDTFFLLENNSTVDATSGNDVFSFFGDVGTVNVQTVTNAGYDQVWIGSDSTDARYWVDNGGELHIRASETSLNELILHGDAYYASGADIASRFEKIVFADGVEIDLSLGLNQLDTDDAHTLYGSLLDDTINGRGGNDNISGFAGNDHLIGGAGTDTLYGGDGNDIIEGGTDADTLQGELGDDSYVWSVGDGNDTINESGGIDQLVIHGVMESELRFVVQYPYNLNIVIDTETIVISQQIASDFTGNSYYDTYQVESLLLDDGTVIDLLNNMTFTGTSAGEYLYGTKTDNALYGLDGTDYLYASDGNDTLYGGVGADNLNGELGNDTYVWSIGDGNDTITDTGGTDKILFGAGITENDISFARYSSYDFKITIGSEEILLSGQYLANKAIETAVLDDGTIIDLLNNVTFTGTSGSDYMWGLSSGDTLKGLAGSDWLYGDSGDDVLIGGEGADMLYGQGGADIFLFDDLASSDNIQDFDLIAGDKLDVSDLLIGYDPLTDAITDFVQITESGGSSYLNVDADGGADNFVQVAYIHNATGLTDEEALETSGNLIAA